MIHVWVDFESSMLPPLRASRCSRCGPWSLMAGCLRGGYWFAVPPIGASTGS